MNTKLFLHLFSFLFFMKWKFKQWWSSIPPISTKQTTTFHLKSLNTKDHNIWCWKSRSWLCFVLYVCLFCMFVCCFVIVLFCLFVCFVCLFVALLLYCFVCLFCLFCFCIVLLCYLFKKKLQKDYTVCYCSFLKYEFCFQWLFSMQGTYGTCRKWFISFWFNQYKWRSKITQGDIVNYEKGQSRMDNLETLARQIKQKTQHSKQK
jgi:hypothetical protein